MLLDLLYITVILVVITDLTDWPYTVKRLISWLMTKGRVVKTDYRLHIVDCSLCQVVWIGMIYLLCLHQFTLQNLCILFLLAFSTVPIKNILQLLSGLINTAISKIQRKL